MPRPARTAPNEHIYHVLTRGDNRKNVFRDEDDYLRYLEIVAKYKEKYSFRLYHYVLMTNHIHLVLEPTEHGGTLAQIMKCINLSYARYFMNKYRRIGHFWQDRYKSIIIAKDDYLLACGSYVELNPVRAKMAEDPKEYRWSSYHAYAYGKSDLLIDEHPIYEQLGTDGRGRQQKYREYIKGMLREKKAMKRPGKGVLHHSDRGSQYCSERYRSLLRQFGMRASMSDKGNCYDNAPMENFWGVLKTELVHHRRYKTRAEAIREITEYIEIFYNRQRRQQCLGFLSPAAFLRQFHIKGLAA